MITLIVNGCLVIFFILYACINLYLIGVVALLLIDGALIASKDPKEWYHRKRRKSFKIIQGGKK